MSAFQQRGIQIRHAHKRLHAASADDPVARESWPADSGVNPSLALATEMRRQAALQYMTLAHSLAVDLRHTIAPPQTTHSFRGVVGLVK